MKSNLILKGVYMWLRSILIRRKSFAEFPKNSSITPPLIYDTPKNIFIGPRVYIGPRACLSATNAPIIFKGHTSVGEDLSIHTGNHGRIIGMFHNDITEATKPKGLDKKVVIDAGHGGDDPGASGNGIVEKNLTLDISKYIKENYRGKEVYIINGGQDVYDFIIIVE